MMQDSLHKKYDDFPGGYFDNGGVHWLLRDGLGSVGMTVDDSGMVEQHVQYYPYGEPHREPQGQPYLYGGKERRRFGGLNDYDFHARFLNPAAALWHAPDPHASLSPWISPYVFCATNPIRRVDPTGMTDRKKENKDLIDASAYEESLESGECNDETNSGNSENDNEEQREGLSTNERVNIATNAATTAMGVKVEIIKSAKALNCIELARYVKFFKCLGWMGAMVVGACNEAQLKEYKQNGGNNIWVSVKLRLDTGVALASNINGWCLGGAIVYTVGDYLTDGYGTDIIIEEQIKSN